MEGSTLTSLFFTLILLICKLSPSSSSSSSSSSSEIISRFQQYLRLDTSQPNPDYFGAVKFLLEDAKSLSLESKTIEFVSGKPVLILKWTGKDPNLPSILLNSHTDIVPSEPSKWIHPPLGAHIDSNGLIYARGSQDMKCVGLQYIEAIRKLKARGFEPTRTIYVSFVPDEEIGGKDGAGKFAGSEVFKEMNVGIVLDEGLASPDNHYRAFYGERSPWWTVIKAVGAPGHGAKMFDNSAMENLLKSIESVRRFRTAQFDLVKSGLKAEGEVVSVNMAFLKAGTPSPTGFVMNLQPSEAEAGFDMRIPPTADPLSIERRLKEEWAPVNRNMSFSFKQKVSVQDKFGKPLVTAFDSSNPWWGLLEEAVKKADGKLGKPEVFPASTDARYFRELGIPAIGFSPMANTPILLHDHNEFLSQDQYLKGIEVYVSIIEAYATFQGISHHTRREEL